MNNILKKRREELGKDINEIADVTRIKRSYLRAIEEDDFEKLPVEVYTKGYIREYAEFLQIPAEQAFEPYEKYLEERKGVKGKEASSRRGPEASPKNSLYPAETKRAGTPAERGYPEVPSLSSVTDQEGETRTASSAPGKIVWTILVLLIAGLAGFYFFGSGVTEAPLPPPPPLKTEAVPVPPVPPEDVQEKTLQENPAAPSALPGTPAPPPAASDGKPEGRVDTPAPEPARPAAAHRLDIAAKGRAWLQIVIDGSEKKEIILNPGERITYKVNENASVLIGNAAGVHMKFDGKQYENLGGEGEVVRIHFPTGEATPVSPARKSSP